MPNVGFWSLVRESRYPGLDLPCSACGAVCGAPFALSLFARLFVAGCTAGTSGSVVAAADIRAPIRFFPAAAFCVVFREVIFDGVISREDDIL
jgi:hypothetical protein